jgi:hypothetical protein
LLGAEYTVKNRADVAVEHVCCHRNGDQRTFSVTRVTGGDRLCRPRRGSGSQLAGYPPLPRWAK